MFPLEPRTCESEGTAQVTRTVSVCFGFPSHGGKTYLTAILRPHFDPPPTIALTTDSPFEQLSDDASFVRYSYQPISPIHLRSTRHVHLLVIAVWNMPVLRDLIKPRRLSTKD